MAHETRRANLIKKHNLKGVNNGRKHSDEWKKKQSISNHKQAKTLHL